MPILLLCNGEVHFGVHSPNLSKLVFRDSLCRMIVQHGIIGLPGLQHEIPVPKQISFKKKYLQVLGK